MSGSKAPGARGEPRRFASFDQYLQETGVADEVRISVEKRIIAEMLEEERKNAGLSKAELARMVGTSRPQIDRVLDPLSQNVTIETLKRVAAALGKRVHIELIG